MQKRISAIQWERKIFGLAKRYKYDGVVSACVRKMRYSDGHTHVSYDAHFNQEEVSICVCYEKDWQDALNRFEKMCEETFK